MTIEKTSTTLTTVNPEATSMPTIRTYEELSKEEQDIVDSLVVKLDDYSDSALIDFSSEAAAESSRDSEDFLKQTKLNDLEEFNECMGSLTKDLRSIDTKELSKQDPNPISRLPIIGPALAKSRMGKKIESTIQKQETVKKSIDLTVKTISDIKLTLREDLIRCDKTRKKTIEFAKALEFEYIALSRKKEELERLYNEFTSSPDYKPGTIDHSEFVIKLQNGIQSLERKMDSTLRYLANAIQDIPSLSIIKEAEVAMITTIDDCIANVIPEWNKAFFKAIIAYRVSNTADVIKSTKQATNSILLTSAQMSANAIVSAAEAIEAPQIATETLEKKTAIFLEMCDKLTQISMDASQKRLEDAAKLKAINQQALEESTKRKTVPLILEESDGNS